MRIARVLALAAFTLVSTAHAQIFRAYLASDGSDANPCTLPAPCRLLPAALTAVASGGEIWMLDSANYNTGTVDITKSVTISSVPGSVGSIVVLSGHGVSIATPDLRVTLRNVTIGPVATAPHGPLAFGINLAAASNLNLDRCVVANLTTEGAHVTAGRLRVGDSVFHDMPTAFNIQGSGRAAIARTRMLNNATGVLAYGVVAGSTVIVTVADSVISGAGGGVGAVAALNAPNATVRLSVSRTLIEGNFTGVRSNNLGAEAGSAIVSVSGSTIVNNELAFHQSGVGTAFFTQSNNHVADNVNANVGNIQYLPPQ